MRVRDALVLGSGVVACFIRIDAIGTNDVPPTSSGRPGSAGTTASVVTVWDERGTLAKHAVVGMAVPCSVCDRRTSERAVAVASHHQKALPRIHSPRSWGQLVDGAVACRGHGELIGMD